MKKGVGKCSLSAGPLFLKYDQSEVVVPFHYPGRNRSLAEVNAKLI